MLRIRRLDPEEYGVYGPRIAAVEQTISYPLGEDSFRIDHGVDYFAFFRRLGELCYLVAEEAGVLLGVLAAVRRVIPGAGHVWYLGDLKLLPGGEGRLLARRLLVAFGGVMGTDRAFGISMNPAAGEPHRVVQLLRRQVPQLESGGALYIHALDCSAMQQAAALLQQCRGPLRYVSLAGIKDLILASTGAPMSLLHVCHGEGEMAAPREGHQHMFCLHEEDPINQRIAALGHVPVGAATILHLGMRGADWSSLQTDEL